jgi:hypothetical protein
MRDKPSLFLKGCVIILRAGEELGAEASSPDHLVYARQLIVSTHTPIEQEDKLSSATLRAYVCTCKKANIMYAYIHLCSRP